jgi:integrase/recombinase XerD
MLIRKEKSTLNQPISVESAFTLLDSFDQSSWIGLRDFTIVSVLWAMGLRLSECLSLKVGDFDPEYNRPKKIGTLRVHGKGRKVRTLFVVDKLYDALADYLDHPVSPQKKSDFMFPTKVRTGKPVSKDRVRRMIKQAAKDAGLTERITPHVLRHTFATHMYERGVPADAISRIMGHDTIEETSQYIHVSDEMKKKALEKIRIPGR